VTVNEIISRARERVNDDQAVGYENTEWIQYINGAIDWLSNLLVSIKYELMVDEFVCSGSVSLPSDYISMVGKEPVYFKNGTVYGYDSNPITIRYWKSMPHISLVTETIPFPDIFNDLIIQIVSIYALNAHEFDVSQDLKLLEEKVKTLTSARVV
jgi:hypothetical protein